MMFTCVNLDGTFSLISVVLHNSLLATGVFEYVPWVFTCVYQRAVLFACVLLENNNMPDMHRFKLTITWFEFILISVSVAA